MKLVEIFDDEDSVVIDDEFSTNTWTLSMQSKKLTLSSSIKNDCFFNSQIYEYKISNDPVGLTMRLLEASSEPPKEFSVKDGVVLETEIISGKEDYFLKIARDRVNELKKSVEWNKVDLFGNYEVNLYLLSKHPEIISKEDYRKFLRYSVERIKMGVLKVEEVVKNDVHDLELSNGEYGKYISYCESEAEKIEREEHWKLKLSNEKKIDSNYGKKLEYIEKLNGSLFKDDSQKFVGVSDYEFRYSNELVEYIEKVLDNKQDISNKNKVDTFKSKDSGNKIKWFVVIILSIIALSLGVWTAVGVFILGAIIINLLTK